MRASVANRRFYLALFLVGGVYVGLIVAMLIADLDFMAPGEFWAALQSPEIRYSIKLSLVSCLVTTVLSLWVAVPLGYLLSRGRFWGKPFLDVLLDVPIVLPPLVIGLSLLILMQTQAGRMISELTYAYMGRLLVYVAAPMVVAVFAYPVARRWFKRADPFLVAVVVAAVTIGLFKLAQQSWDLEETLTERFRTRITYEVPSVILAQFAVSCAFAVRTMRVTFDQISPRTEQVALTLGCTRGQAFWRVALPEARRGLVSAAGIAWARALGEFGPILVFAGATRMRTEVLSTTVFLELSIGKLDAALAVSLLMVAVAVAVLLLIRGFGLRGGV